MPGLHDEKISAEVPFGHFELMPRLLDNMPSFGVMCHQRLLRVLHHLMPCEREKACRAREKNQDWIKQQDAKTATSFEHCVYELRLIVTKHVNVAWPNPDPHHKNEALVMDDQLLPDRTEFLAHVYHLRLDITLDLCGLSNAAKVEQVKQQLDQFSGLKKADVRIWVRSMNQAIRDGTWNAVTLFLYTYRDRRGIELSLWWTPCEWIYFPETEREQWAIDFATDPRLGLRTAEEQHRAFRATLSGRAFHG